MIPQTTCGIVIYAAKEKQIRTCGAKATHALIVKGDQLFGLCPRHNKRLGKAFPGLKEIQRT